VFQSLFSPNAHDPQASVATQCQSDLELLLSKCRAIEETKIGVSYRKAVRLSEMRHYWHFRSTDPARGWIISTANQSLSRGCQATLAGPWNETQIFCSLSLADAGFE
jgi:hypothetical protein